MNKQTYKYSHIEDETEKYIDSEPDENGFYSPVYTQSKNKMDIGNPLIECLPAPKNETQVWLKYSVPIADYEKKKIPSLIKSGDMITLANSILQLRKLRIALPMSNSLESGIYRLLLESYRDRSMMSDADTDLPVHLGNAESSINSKLYTDFTATSPSGIAVLGYAGSGKTIAVHTMLSGIPQVIVHSTKETPQFIQVVWLDVECAPNSNLGAIWDGFGSALDRALHNLDGYYHNLITKKHNASAKLEIVIDLIQQFNIGVICFDEIEHINFSANKTSSFEEFLYLQDKTNVGLVVIGTEETYLKMFGQLRSQRRFNHVIHASSYCHDQYAKVVAKQIMDYQWFTPMVNVSDEKNGGPLVQSLVDCTKGIVDQMIALWILVNLTLADSSSKKRLTPDLIKSVAEKEIPEVTNELLYHLDDPMAGSKREQLNKQAEQKMINEIFDKSEKKKTDTLAAQVSQTSMQSVQSLITDAIKVIRIYNKQFDAASIKKAVMHVISQDGGEKLPSDEVIRQTTDYLLSKEKSKNTKKPKAVKNSTTRILPTDFLNNLNQDTRAVSQEERF